MCQLDIHQLVKDLNELCNTLAIEYNINCGGCCYVASEIARHLDKFHINYDLCIVNDYPLDTEDINSEVRNKCKNYNCDSVSGDATCYHYYLIVDGIGSINSGMDLDSPYYTCIITGINHKNLNWLYRTSIWNPVYNPENNKFVRKCINTYFKQYGEDNKTNLCF